MKSLFLVGVLSTFLCFTVRADLKWEQTTVELHPAVGDSSAVGHFKYRNAGKAPVRFKSIKTSCGCTAAQTQKEEVPPGENGEIIATYKIGDHVGTQVKTVTVETSEDPPVTTVLTLKSILPEMMTIVPTFVYWNPGDEPKPKSIQVKAGKDFAATNIRVTSSSPQFLATVEPDKKGEWTVKVRPKDTSKPSASSLTIQSDFPKDNPRVFYANASVTGTPVVAPPAAK